MFRVRLRALLQLVPIDLNKRGSSGSYDLQSVCLKYLSRCALNELREVVTERLMSSARAKLRNEACGLIFRTQLLKNVSLWICYILRCLQFVVFLDVMKKEKNFAQDRGSPFMSFPARPRGENSLYM